MIALPEDRKLWRLKARFWAKVNKCGPVPSHRPELGRCWEWMAGKNKKGYGIIWVGGSVLVHRLSWVICKGKPIPKGKQVLHKCDNPVCVRLSHLFLGLNRDNVDDKVAKGRTYCPQGERHGRHKLTEAQVRKIRKLYARGGTTHRELGKRFSVAHGQIGKLITRKLWKNVE